jgi:type IV pilus assembly protein PilP
VRPPIGSHRAGLLLCLVLLSACAPSVDDSLVVWLQAERQALRPPPQALPDVSGFTPQLYQTEGLDEPFASERLVRRLRDAAPPIAEVSVQVDPRRTRHPQPLEARALERMTLVGSLSREGQRLALVQVAQQLYPVRIGDHVGLHQGRVQRITERQIDVRERFQDAHGEWVDRTVSMMLQEPAP